VDPDGGDAGWDGPPLDIQIPDDARELERDVLAYRRELRAIRRRRRIRRFLPAQAGIMPLIASILAVCLVAGMMLSVFTISPVESPGKVRTPSVNRTSQPASPSPSSRAGTPSPGPSAGTRQSGQPSTRPSTTPRVHATA
jgi:hypothetical protein